MTSTAELSSPSSASTDLTRSVLDADYTLEDKYRRAEGRCRANYGFYMGASNDNLADVRAIDPKATPQIDLPTHRVRIESAQPAEAFAKALAEEGYVPA